MNKPEIVILVYHAIEAAKRKGGKVNVDVDIDRIADVISETAAYAAGKVEHALGKYVIAAVAKVVAPNTKYASRAEVEAEALDYAAADFNHDAIGRAALKISKAVKGSLRE